MAPKIEYAPGMSHELLVDKKKVDGNTVYKVKIECGATGGRYTYASEMDAVDAALKNLLSHYPKDHAVWINPQAASFRREALKYAKGGTRPPKPQPTGAFAFILPNVQLRDRAGGRTVQVYQRQEDGVVVSHTVEFHAAGIAAVRATASADVLEHCEQFLADATACEWLDVEDVNSHLQEQALAKIRLEDQRADDECAEKDLVADDGLNEKLREICIKSGWADLTGDEIIPEAKDRTVSYLGSIKCLVHSDVMASYYGTGGTGPREGHDKRLKLYRAAISELELPGYENWSGWEAMVFERVPKLKWYIDNTEGRERKAFINVLKYLVKNTAIDHVWSSAVDHPKNCFFEWSAVNNYFSDFNNQAAKLRRYGATAKAVSIAWMDECIAAEAKCLSVA